MSRFILSQSTIRRLYDQGLDSIVRLVTKLEDQIQDLTVLHTSNPQRTITVLSGEIKRLAHTLEQKTRQLTETHQLNHQLQQRIRELEQLIESETASAAPVEVIKRDSHNSSAPPSSDAPWNKPKRTRSLRKKSNRAVGGQPGHRGTTLRQVGNPDRIIVHLLDACPTCNAPFSPADTIRFCKRQVFDVADGRLFVTEHRTAVNCCPACNRTARARFPAVAKAPAQYGENARAKSIYLHLYQLLPVARTAEAMRDLFACPMSAATVQRATRLCAGKLVRSEQRIKARIRDSAVIGVDETGVRVNGTVVWVHAARTDSLTHFAVHPKRGRAAFEQIGIIKQFKGTLVRDGWFSYKWYTQCRHSLCNAHLLRDLTFIEEAYPKHNAWTAALSKLLIEIKDAIALARSDQQTRLSSEQQDVFLQRYDRLLANAEQAVRGSPARRSNQLSPRQLLNRLINNKPEILRFMVDFAVPFDNNGTERDLRMLKLQQKVSGCFRTSEGAQAFCRVRSYLSSARKQGGSVLVAIECAFAGKPVRLTN
ncbi:MAG TPA: IS66 family transposase [Pyrinomonadaceae bacterium]|nr:IS66 family transposase [Pyrinomonadaceae bacterium]